ncbi:MAG: hypothetical protein JO353_00445, partial [Phycisphaerae bacterium]|nr:hypothetical protein [Phycisphaerae bacterium]
MNSTARIFRLSFLLLISAALMGCRSGPALIEQSPVIDRSIVEYPPNVQLTEYADGLTGPSAIAFDYDEGDHKGTMVIAESGRGGHSPRLYGFTPDGRFFDIYPRGKLPHLPSLPFDIGRGPFDFDPPIGGIVISGGRIFVTHRDRNGRGVLTSFGYDGSHTTVVSDLPAQGEFGVTDVAVRPSDGRIFFGLGSMTNSGVVGLDDWAIGWVQKHPEACDLPATNLKLYGYRFDTKNPLAGLFGPDETAVTAPFQPFNISNRVRISKAVNDKPTGAIYSVSPGGGDLRVEATGLRYPRGLAFDAYSLYFTDDGMEMRGTRPVKDDPDSLLKWVPGTYYGFPDFSTDLYPISDRRFQPPVWMIIKSGYPELSPVISLGDSDLVSPAPARESLLRATFPSLSGAARFDIVPSDGPFREMRGNAVIALGGDRSPFATSGVALKEPVGCKVVRCDPDQSNGTVSDFVYNTRGLPAHLLGRRERDIAMERPVDA